MDSLNKDEYTSDYKEMKPKYKRIKSIHQVREKHNIKEIRWYVCLKMVHMMRNYEIKHHWKKNKVHCQCSGKHFRYEVKGHKMF